MSSQPISIPALPQEQPGAIWPTLVARNDDRARRGPNTLASGASGPIVGDSKMGSRASASVQRSWRPTASASSPSPSPSSAQRQTAAPVAVGILQHATMHPLPQPTAVTPANQVMRTFTGKSSAPVTGAPAAGMPPIAPAPARGQTPATPTGGPAAPAWPPRAVGSAAPIGVARGASSSEEGRATVALAFGFLSVVIPIVVAQAAHDMGNVAAFILAIVALVFAGRALSVSVLSGGSRARAGWAIVIAVVVIVVWIIAFTQGY